MKNLILIFSFMSFSLFAEEVCFTTDKQVKFYDVPETVCVSDISVELEYFFDSKISAVINGKKVTTKIPKYAAKKIENGYLIVTKVLEDSIEEGTCDEYKGYELSLKLEISKSGDIVDLKDLIGKAFYTGDYCHNPAGYLNLEYKK